MLRLAVIRPNHEQLALYGSGIQHPQGFQITHVVGNELIAGAKLVENERALCKLGNEFDACVVHSPISDVDQLSWLLNLQKHALIGSTTYDATTLTDLERVWSPEVHLAVMQPRRHTAYATGIRAGLDAGQLGSPGLVRIHRWEKAAPSQPAEPRLWWLLAGEVDLACWLFHGPPDLVFASRIHSPENLDGLQVQLGFATGMTIIDCLVHQQEAYYSASLIGSHGAAYADDHHNTNLLFKEGVHGLLVRGEDNWLLGQLAQFAGSVADTRPDRSIDETAQVIRVSLAAVNSAAQQRPAKRMGDRYELQ